MRLFVALALPADLRHALVGATAPLRDAFGQSVAWTDAEKLHLTLQFIGSADERLAIAIAPAIRDAVHAHAPFEMRLAGIGAFPSARKPRIVWVGIDANPRLSALYQVVTGATAALGVPTEARPFRPHVTLGRVRPGRTVDGRRFTAIARTIAWTADAPVRTVDLMESTLGAGGARYRRLDAAPLGTLVTEV